MKASFLSKSCLEGTYLQLGNLGSLESSPKGKGIGDYLAGLAIVALYKSCSLACRVFGRRVVSDFVLVALYLPAVL